MRPDRSPHHPEGWRGQAAGALRPPPRGPPDQRAVRLVLDFPTGRCGAPVGPEALKITRAKAIDPGSDRAGLVVPDGLGLALP